MAIFTPLYNSYYVTYKIIKHLETKELTRSLISVFILVESIRGNKRLLNKNEIIKHIAKDKIFNPTNFYDNLHKLRSINIYDEKINLTVEGVRLKTSINRLYKLELNRLIN